MSIITQEKKKEYNKRYYEKNRNKIRNGQRTYYKENREVLLEKQNYRSKKYYKNNREKILERIRTRYANNLNGAYDRKSYLARERHKRNRQLMFDALGGAMCMCGFDDIRAIEVDHVNGGGKEHRKKLSNAQYRDYVISHPNEFQVLCSNCHSIKTYERGEVRQRNVRTS